MRIRTTLLGLLAGCMLSFALAQTPARATDVDPSILFELLGSVNAITIDVPSDVHRLFVMAMHQDEVLLSLDAEVPFSLDPIHASIQGGGLTGVGHCPTMAFARIELARERGRSVRLQSTCLETPDAPQRTVGSILVPGPFGQQGFEVDLPSETWLLFEAARFIDGVVGGGGPKDVLAFYVLLRTDDHADPPEPPGFETWEEVQEAFQAHQP